DAGFLKWKYVRVPIPDELWSAAADLSQHYPPSLVGRVLKLDPSRLKKLLIKRSAPAPVRKKPQAAFFHLPTEIALPEVEAPVEISRRKPPSYSGGMNLPSSTLRYNSLSKLLIFFCTIP